MKIKAELPYAHFQLTYDQQQNYLEDEVGFSSPAIVMSLEQASLKMTAAHIGPDQEGYGKGKTKPEVMAVLLPQASPELSLSSQKS